MKLLLDTHALLWWATGSGRLGDQAAAAIADPANDVLVSAASIWEIATKVRIGRLPEGRRILLGFDEFMTRSRFGDLAMSRQHAVQAGSFDVDHRDPFDRMLAAQSALEGAVLVTLDPAFASFPVATLW